MLSKNRIKYLKQLKDRKYREAERLYLVEGTKMVNEAITQKKLFIEQIICTQDVREQIYSDDKIEYVITNYENIKRISSFKTPQKAIAIIKLEKHELNYALKIDDIALALDNIKDPGNMGTILRLADWFGIQQIYCSYDCVDCYNPKVVQASMGAIFRIKCYYYDLNSFLKQKSSDGINIYGATLDGDDIYKFSFELPAIILMGNESIGISEINKRYLTKEILIPNFSVNHSKSESLNVSTATSVILGEFRRQQYYSK